MRLNKIYCISADYKDRFFWFQFLELVLGERELNNVFLYFSFTALFPFQSQFPTLWLKELFLEILVPPAQFLLSLSARPVLFIHWPVYTVCIWTLAVNNSHILFIATQELHVSSHSLFHTFPSDCSQSYWGSFPSMNSCCAVLFFPLLAMKSLYIKHILIRQSTISNDTTLHLRALTVPAYCSLYLLIFIFEPRKSCFCIDFVLNL